jgi:hypothetical protein
VRDTTYYWGSSEVERPALVRLDAGSSPAPSFHTVYFFFGAAFGGGIGPGVIV